MEVFTVSFWGHRSPTHMRSDNSSLVWVLPYATAEFEHNLNAHYPYYDEIGVLSILPNPSIKPH